MPTRCGKVDTRSSCHHHVHNHPSHEIHPKCLPQPVRDRVVLITSRDRSRGGLKRRHLLSQLRRAFEWSTGWLEEEAGAIGLFGREHVVLTSTQVGYHWSNFGVGIVDVQGRPNLFVARNSSFSRPWDSSPACLLRLLCLRHIVVVIQLVRLDVLDYQGV